MLDVAGAGARVVPLERVEFAGTLVEHRHRQTRLARTTWIIRGITTVDYETHIDDRDAGSLHDDESQAAVELFACKGWKYRSLG